MEFMSYLIGSGVKPYVTYIIVEIENHGELSDEIDRDLALTDMV